MPAGRSLPPLEFCGGASPIQAARSLGFGDRWTLATKALASTGPMPGISSRLKKRQGQFHKPG
jgi:hypothetical protein